MPCFQQVFASMTDEQRVGQLFLLGLGGNQLGPAEVDAIRTHHLGSVWFVDQSSASVDEIRSTADAVQSQASTQSTGNVRFFIAANQEGGEIQPMHGSGFSRIPSASVQGQLDPSVLQRDAAIWARELLAAGINLNFAPVMDVVPPGTDSQNQPIGALHREYGQNPATSGSHGTAFLQGMRQGGVATTEKHFPGLGRVKGNTDFASAVLDDSTTSNDSYLESFRQGIDAGVPFVMIALATYTRIDPNHLAVFSPTVMRSILRGTLNYKGVIVSDDLGATAAVAGIPPGERAIDFLLAGGDMIISKASSVAVTMSVALMSRMGSDRAFRSLVEDAARRILEAKEAAGLLTCLSG